MSLLVSTGYRSLRLAEDFLGRPLLAGVTPTRKHEYYNAQLATTNQLTVIIRFSFSMDIAYSFYQFPFPGTLSNTFLTYENKQDRKLIFAHKSSSF